MESRQAVNQLQFNLDQPASPRNLVTRVATNPQPLLIEKRIDPRRMELLGRLARRELQHSRERLDAGLPPGPKNVERRLRQGRAVVSKKVAEQQQQPRQQLPSRSHSPPVRDTDRAWRPGSLRHPRENAASMKRHEALELRRLREEVQQYAARMAELEAERLLGRGGVGGSAKRRPAALPFPTRPRSPRVAPPVQQPLRQQPNHPARNQLPPVSVAPAPARAQAQAPAAAADPAANFAASERERDRIVAEVLAAVRRELGLRGGPADTPALSASAASLMHSGSVGSLAELRNIDHRLSQLEAEGDDIRDRWAAALAAGDEPICSIADSRWRVVEQQPDPLRFVNNRARPEAAVGNVASGNAGSSRQAAVLRLTPAEVQSIRSQRDRFRDFVSAGGTDFGAAFKPTQLTDAIAEQLLDELLADAAGELLAASDAIVNQLVANETGAPAEPSQLAPLEDFNRDQMDRRRDSDYYDDYEEAYGSPEFESEHSSDEADD